MLQSHRWSFRDEGSGDEDQCYYIESDTSLKDILSKDKEKIITKHTVEAMLMINFDTED